MATNEILPFGDTASGADILTQSAYNGDSQRSIGHQAAGDARRELVNKTLKQVSKVASGVAQYIASNQSSDVTDSVTTSTMATMLANAINTSIDARTQSGETVYADRFATLALAIAAAGSGGKVILPSNFTFSTGNIDLSSYQGITIEGNGDNSVVHNTNDAAPCFYFNVPAGQTRIAPTFKNLKIISKYGIRINSTTGVFPESPSPTQGYAMYGGCVRVYFESNTTGGIGFEASVLFDSYLKHCIFDSISNNLDTGIHLYGCDLNSIRDNRFHNIRLCSIDVESHLTFGSQNIIEHNDIMDMTTNGAVAHIKASDRCTIIKNNYFEQIATLSPLLEACILIKASVTSSPLSVCIADNRFDTDASYVSNWLKFTNNPASISTHGNIFNAGTPPGVTFTTPVTYWYNVFRRRDMFVKEQARANFPFHTEYGKVWDQNYAYYFAPHLPGHATNDVSTNMVCRNGAFVIDNNSLIHHFQSVLVDGGRTGFTATITIIAKADVNNNHLVVMEMNSVTAPGGAHYVDLTLTDKKAKYTYLTSTAISDNFEILLINSGAGDIEVYAIIVEYG